MPLAAQATTGEPAPEGARPEPIMSVAAVLRPLAALHPEPLHGAAAAPAMAGSSHPVGVAADRSPAAAPALPTAPAGGMDATPADLWLEIRLAAPGAPGSVFDHGRAATVPRTPSTPAPDSCWLRHPMVIALAPSAGEPPAAAQDAHDAPHGSRWQRRLERIDPARPDWLLLIDLDHAGELDNRRLYSDHHGVAPINRRWDLRVSYRPDQVTEISLSLQDVFDPLRTDQFFHGEREWGVGLLFAHRF